MKPKITFYLLSLCSLSIPIINAQEKVLIVTHSYTQPEFIRIQNNAFKKFIKDSYEYVVFNDAPTDLMAQQIKDTCDALRIKCIRIPQEIHSYAYLNREQGESLENCSVRHACALQYSFNNFCFDWDGIVCIIDSDCFPIRQFSIVDYMQNTDIASVLRRGHNWVCYLCPVLSMFTMNKLPDKRTINFNCGRINNSPVDSGGYTYYYLTKHKDLKIKRINILYSHQLFLGDRHLNLAANSKVKLDIKIAFYRSLGFNDEEIDFLLQGPDTFEFYLDNQFLHFRGASWESGHTASKWKIFKDFINKLFNEKDN